MKDGSRARRAGLPRRLKAHLERSGLLVPDDSVLVALSGGLDSVALLHLLRFGLDGWSLSIRAAHIDHAMRATSAADAAWVRGLCAAWDVPVVVERLESAPSGEEAAREARYGVLREIRDDREKVATAHHADDQAETLLFRMARGTGVRGLRGVAPRRGHIVRPLLPFTRAEIQAYAEGTGLSWRTDPTNADIGLARNRIRHRVIPELESVRPGAVRALSRLADLARANESAWESVADRLESDLVQAADERGATLARDTLLSYHPQVRARLLRGVLRRYGCMPDRAGTHAALEFIRSGTSGRGIDLPGGARLERSFDEIRVAVSGDDDTADRPARIHDAGPGSAEARLGGATWGMRWRPVGAGGEGSESGDDGERGRGERGAEHRLRLDPAAVEFPLELRGWRPGDRIRLEYGTKKLKKLFGEARVGRHARGRVPVLVDAKGRVLWVVGVAESVDAGSPTMELTISVVHGE